MNTKEKLIYAVGTEIDVYINLLQERVVENQDTRNFICRTVLPRFNILRDIIHECEVDDSIKLEDC